MRSENSESEGPEAGTEELQGSPRDVTEDQPDGAGEEEYEEGESDPRVGSGEGSLQELEALRDRYLRLAAEYENFRKRTDRERVDARDRAQGQIVEKLLEPLDDLQRVAQYSSDGTTVDTLLEGVRLVERKLVRILESAGLEVVEAKGEAFDPELHDALMMTPTDDQDEDDTVGEVFQQGYRFRGGLLRPARVQVKKFEG